MADPDRVADVFGAACEASADERDAFLESACAGDVSLRAEVDSLLAAHFAAGTFLGGPAETHTGPALEALDPAPAPERIGPYRVRRELGRGGMGVVYLAERAEGGFEQSVALKLIKRGMDSDALVGRFLRERQILAGLDHPNVARLLDGGVTSDGQPYFAMEYIDGAPLTQYCDSRRLGLEPRLRLFEETCRAVQYAHGQLLVHRDLKPSNILVTAEGQPKLLDFGVAKLLQQDGQGTSLTRTHDLLLTPEYAAPEQLRGAAATTATDVYALGVILYELLTGRPPFRAGGPHGLLLARATREMQTLPPSAAAVAPPDEAGRSAEERAADRGLTAKRLGRRLAGDLDVIVLKALRQEPERRYASAEGLAEDVRRHLAGHPVTARRDTVAYRAASFVRRHRLGVAAAAVVLLSLLMGLVGTAWQARRAGREARRAHAVQAFLVDVFQRADPTRSLGETVTARQLLDEGARRLEREAGEDPAAHAELADTLARTYRSLGLLEAAATWSGRAIAGFRERLGPDHARTILAEVTDAEIRADRGEVAAARAALDALVPKAAQAYGEDSPEHVRAREARVTLLFHSGEPEEALAEERAILVALQGSRGPDHIETASQEGDVAEALALLSRYAEAEQAFRSALARLERAQGLRSPQGVMLETHFADFLELVGKRAEAGPHFQAALERGRAVLGPRHPQVAQVLIKYGFLLIVQNENAQAQASLEEAVSILEPLGHFDAGSALRYLGILYVGLERLPEAAEALARAEHFFRVKLGGDDPLTWAAVVSSAQVEARLGRQGEAEKRLREAIPALTRLHGARSNEVRLSRQHLGEVLRRAGRFQEAEATHREVLDHVRELFGAQGSLALASAKHQLALDLLEAGRAAVLPEGRVLTDEAVAFLRAHEPDPKRLGDFLTTSARIAAAQGDVGRARLELREAVQLLASARGEDAPSVRTARRLLVTLPL